MRAKESAPGSAATLTGAGTENTVLTGDVFHRHDTTPPAQRQVVSEWLGVGEANAKTMRELKAFLNGDSRKIRQQIERERRAGCPILSGQNGYWICASQDECEHFSRDVGGSKDIYGKDYADIGTLKKFADAHNIALLLIHHLRKGGDDSDPFARISGTNGISGAADTMMVLAKEKRGDDTATLSVTGRDVEQMDLVLRFNKSSCTWENLGDTDAFAEQQARADYEGSPIVQTVRKLLKQSPDGWSGSGKQLLDAGAYIARTRLADSSKALSSKLDDLDGPLLENDNIIHERTPNGSGAKGHRFY